MIFLATSSSFFYMELCLLSFEERDKFTLQRVEGKQQNWWWIPPPPPKKKCYVFGEWNSVRIVPITDPKRRIVGKIYIC